MDSGNVDGRYYVHCTIKVKIFFALHHFMEIRPLERDSHRQMAALRDCLIETDNYRHIIKSFLSMIRGADRSRIPKDPIHGATFL